jgi:hypothetical protein
MALTRSDDRPHAGAAVEEWVFVAWTSDAELGLLSGLRVLERRAWYWACVAAAHEPLLHVSEWEVPVRADPMLVKAHGLWAEHVCDAPMEQWTVANETYAAALDDPAAALDRAYGTPTPIAVDLEWYATAEPEPIEHGYAQRGVAHGTVEVGGRPRRELAEVAAHRWHRWSTDPAGFGPVALPSVVAHTNVRAPFSFPDGTVTDLVLTRDGWRERSTTRTVCPS